ncbi:MAG: carboxypeptidase regulatory-like domain-containing protein, partial [Terracidiphilus sp.]
MPGALVTLRGPRSMTSTATAISDGSYEFPSLAPGSYQVSASAPQLASPEAVRIVITTGRATLDLRLRVVAQRQEVRVDDAALAVATENSANAGAVVIQGDDLQALGDDAQDLQADLQALAGPAAGPNGGAIYIDGFSGGQMPPKESIREVRINQNPFAPEYDKIGYGRVEIFTKPGSDHWKGTLGVTFANQIWNSRNPYATEKAPLHLQEYENSFGGSLGHRTSFTMDLERHAVDNGYISNGETLNSATFEPEPFNTIQVTPQRHTLVSPLLNYQLTSADTVSLRYNFTHASVDGAGASGFDEASRGYKLNNGFQTAQVSNTFASRMWINETRFQFFRWAQTTVPFSAAPMLQVLGAFNSGGATVGQGADTQNSFEFQDYVSVIRGAHSWRFGARLREAREISVARNDFNGTFTFTSIETYRQTLLGVPGYGPSQFSLTTGQPELAVRQFDAALFWGDEWKVRDNATISYGFRYETQTNIDDRQALAPRVAVAWAPGHTRDGRTTVFRAGAGIFYDRFPLSDVLTARRFNGAEQSQYVVSSPTFFPSMPDPAELAISWYPQVVWRQDSRLRAPYIIQSALSLEQQVARTTALAFTYTTSHGLHQFRSRVLNAGSATPVFMMTSSGLYNQNQVVANIRTKPSSQVSLFGYYVYNRASSNTDGLSTFPSNPDSDSGEYGPAATDIRHRSLVGGSLQMRGSIRISPYVMLQSGAPFNITTGQDRYGTTLFNSRP